MTVEPADELDLGGARNDFPRKLLADLSSDVDVDPYTKDLVICARKEIPEEVFKQFPFVRNGKLVEGFSYDPMTGDVDFNDIAPAKKSEQMRGSVIQRQPRYARLITTNWWYSELLFTFCIVSLIVMGKNSNILFCITLLGEGAGSPIPQLERRLVVAFAFIFEGVQLRIYMKMASNELLFRTDASGDIIVGDCLHGKGKHAPYWALVMFHILEINGIVKDIIKYAHPFKDRQPYAALKADGHRAFMFGFRSKHSFEVLKNPRPSNALLAQISIEALLLIIKVLSAFATGSWPYFFMAVPGAFIIYIKLAECWSLALHKEQYWDHLIDAYTFGTEGDKKAAEKTKGRMFPNRSFGDAKKNERQRLLMKIAVMVLFLSICAAVLCHAEWRALVKELPSMFVQRLKLR